jgi:hypothetical protein
MRALALKVPPSSNGIAAAADRLSGVNPGVAGRLVTPSTHTSHERRRFR